MKRWCGAMVVTAAAVILTACGEGPPSDPPAGAQDQATEAADPAGVVGSLLDADRAFAAAAADTGLVDALGAMFAADVVMPLPDGSFARSREAALDALRAQPTNAGARLSWAPLRGGVSADGLHGFTFGTMTLTSGDGTTTPLKYLAYWVRGTDGWRVAAYKRARAGVGDPPSSMLDPSLPAAMVRPVADSVTLAAHAESLRLAEQAFSDEAQTIGLGPAFARHGHPDAMNMGGPDAPGFTLGAEAIGQTIGAGAPSPTSPVSWSADQVLVASSGDLGVTFGFIRSNEPGAGGPPNGFPFFTVWRRNGPGEPWRYIAE